MAYTKIYQRWVNIQAHCDTMEIVEAILSPL